MKKKITVPFQDKKDWISFTKKMENISVKDIDINKKNIELNEVKQLDLHGFSLVDANKIVEKFIVQSFNNGYRKLHIVTGKGIRSKSYANPYVSEKLSVLKNSVPEYIKNDEKINWMVGKITYASQKDGGEGAINILLKKNKKL